MNTVLLLMLMGAVLMVLLSETSFFYGIFQRMLVRNSETTGTRTVYQVSSTVNDYLDETISKGGVVRSRITHMNLSVQNLAQKLKRFEK